MKILITGGAGYIGTHTCVELLNAGHDILVLDNFSNSKPEALERVGEITGKFIEVCEADLQDRATLESIFYQNEIDAVIHFAGLKAVGESVEKPLKYYHNNVAGTVTLCEVMDKYNVRNLVFSSSATVYGENNLVPFTEDLPLSATNPYGRSKLIIEEILRDTAASNSNWSVALLRYFNPVGAHNSGLIGEDPSGVPNNLMPYISQVAVGKLPELQVFGDDYPTRDGTGVRDYIHVVDLALGHVRALEKIVTDRGIEAYNLGTGRGCSVLELVKSFEAACGKTIPFKIADRRAGDIAECYADVTKAERDLGWKATFGIDDMCMSTWKWQTLNPTGYEVTKKEITV
ncbi:UDP-glucose 4-epimerase GalE [Alteribacter natronophilus]|uniref:UDP-glucose 4-epimerase GalE n=1 Tax=Alteribacter natronophilus TaxID=2583810 RepID=UPI00110D8403|nr:UDP-glucose 4-epimerase GalE [Alteribacter natronophilus]TMW70537.1 UDP-glucose 4-epimerase GalE [Alteribacter natronophilus]